MHPKHFGFCKNKVNNFGSFLEKFILINENTENKSYYKLDYK